MSATCGRDPNEVEALLHERNLGETVCPDDGLHPGQHGWSGKQPSKATPELREHLRRIGVKEHAARRQHAARLGAVPVQGQAMTTGITDDLREVAERVRRDVRTRLAEVEAEQKRLRGDLDHLDAFLDGRTYSPERGLKGAKLGRAARDVLRASGPMHYRDVFERIRAVSEIGGRDPLATTLTAITRDPYVRRVNGSRSGVYALIEEE